MHNLLCRKVATFSCPACIFAPNATVWHIGNMEARGTGRHRRQVNPQDELLENCAIMFSSQ